MTMLAVALFLAAVASVPAICLYIYIGQQRLRKRAEAAGFVTLDGAWPVIGHLLLFLCRSSTEVHRAVYNISHKHRKDGVVRVEILNKEGYVLCRPDTVKALLGTHNVNKATLYAAFMNWFGKNSIAIAPTERWTPIRKVINEAFKSHVLTSYHSDFNKAAIDFCGRVADNGNQIDDLNAHMFLIANDVLYSTTFGFHNTYPLEQKFEKASIIQGMFKMFSSRYTNPFYQIDRIFHRTALGKKWRHSISKISELSADAIRHVQQDMFDAADDKPFEKRNIIELMLKNGFSKETIAMQLNTFQSAGADTVSDGLTWMVYYTAFYTDIQRRLIELIDSELPNYKPGDDVPAEAVKKLRLVDYVMKEALRIRAPGSLMGRQTISEIKMDDGKVIPVGSECWFNGHAVHMDDQVYEKPTEFRPDRWETNTASNMAYLPFGEGRRICVGWRHAEETMRYTLIHILLRYRLEAVSNPDTMPFEYHGTLHPMKPIQIRFIPRERPAV